MSNKLISAWQEGYICAVANIIRTHGETTIAKDVLRAGGEVDWTQVDANDLETLRDAGLLPKD